MVMLWCVYASHGEHHLTGSTKEKILNQDSIAIHFTTLTFQSLPL